MQHEFTVESLKTRLDKYLAEQLKEISRSQIQRDIEGGCVLVNGEIITSSKFVVRINDVIKYNPSDIPSAELKATNTPLKILYNNHGLLIIDKPAGLTVHPGAGFKGETLASALLYHFSAKGGSASGGKNIHLVGEDHRPGIVHRLDKETSGVILVATTQEMYEHLKDAFLERKVKKEYIALVFGKVEKAHGIIETPIGKSKTDFRKQTTQNPVEGKPAVTEYKVLEYLSAPSPRPSPTRGEGEETGVDEMTLILVKLHTGRTHQIRVHFASIGHPLMGDALYGSKRTKLQGLNRQFLHARKIEVQMPASPDPSRSARAEADGSQGGPDKTWIEAESELSEDLRKVLVGLNSKVVKDL